MCGRYKLATPTGELVEEFHIRGGLLNLQPRYNIAPSQMAPVVRQTPPGRHMAMLRWGLIPAWAKDSKIAYSTINARAETVAEKPAFRQALKQRRCLVLADGFYEWKSEAGGKQPYLFTRSDAKPMAFAGLWERWEKGPEPIESFTIIVTDANDTVRAVHDRMPVILAPEHFDMWLDSDRHGPADVIALLKPFSAEPMSLEPVSRALNSPKNEGPEVLEKPTEQISAMKAPEAPRRRR